MKYHHKNPALPTTNFRRRRQATAAAAPDHRPSADTPAVVVTGVLSRHPRGFGFVTLETGEPDLFIPPKGMLLHSLSGDRVQAQVTEPARDGRGACGRITRLLQHRPASFYGELREDTLGWNIRPMSRELPESIPVGRPVFAGTGEAAVSGVWVEAELVRRTTGDHLVSAHLLRSFGKTGDPGGIIEAVIREFDLPPPYTPAENQAAAVIAPRPMHRENLQHLAVVTIDPADAKDFDDALSIEPGPTPGVVRVGVFIADVAAYVAPGAELDVEAARRSFTSYIPGRTLPMLPRVITGDRCSLVTDRLSLAHCIFFDINQTDGQILATRRCHATIQVRARLTFDQAQQFIDQGVTGTDWSPAVVEALAGLRDLSRVMRARRIREENFLELAATEIRVKCSENPTRILGIVREAPNAAHELVEEFMLAANTAVAAELDARKIPGLYRIHPPPTPGDLEELKQWLGTVFNLRPKRLSSAKTMNRFLESVKNTPANVLITGEVLRSLQRAGYSSTVQSHYGLGKECYSHFTSPIRRYPDLVVHQQLWAADTGAGVRGALECAAIAKDSSEKERTVDSA